MDKFSDRLNVTPKRVDQYRIPLGEINLDSSFPDHGELDYKVFCEKFCLHFGLNASMEEWDSNYARVGKAGLAKLYAQYQARQIKNQVHARRMRLLASCLGATLAVAGLDQAVKYDLDQDALAWAGKLYAEKTDQPFPVHATKYFPTGIERVDAHKNILGEDVEAMLETCRAEGYVLTECREGRVYRPRPYEGHPVDNCETRSYRDGEDENGEPRLHYYRSGECGEKFFGLEHHWSYGWQSTVPGKVQTDLFNNSNIYFFHPVSPTAEQLCEKETNGVFIAPIVDTERTQPLPPECRAGGVFPVMSRELPNRIR